MRAANAFNLNRLRSLSRRPCSLAVALMLVLTAENHREMFECAHLKFTVSGRSKAKHTHTRAQCSHASVGLAQARPNYCSYSLTCECPGSS